MSHGDRQAQDGRAAPRGVLDFQAPLDPSTSHIPALDGVRGLAILLVLLIHVYYRGPVVSTDQTSHPLLAGWLGVDLFFVLSGFLITAILLKTRSDPGYLRNFYLKRVFRIFPLYYAALLGVMALGLAVRALPPLLASVVADANRHMAWYLAYAANWAPALHVSLGKATVALGPLWSLAIEEQFYLVWPLLMLLTPQRWLTALLLALMAAVAALRWALEGAWSTDAIYQATITHCDGLIFGSLLAVLARALGPGRTFFAISAASLAGGFAVLLAVFLSAHAVHYSNPAVEVLGFTPAALMWGGLIGCSMFVRPLRRVMSLGLLRRLGRYSYFIYIAHWPCLLLLSQLRLPPGYVSYALFLIAFTATMMALGWLSFTLFEQPMLRLRDRFQRLLKAEDAPESGTRAAARSPLQS